MKKYSFSQIQLYLKCPLAYEFAYIKKIPQRISHQASFWTTIHKTLYIFLERIKKNIESPTLFSEHIEDTSLEWLLEIFHDSWISAWFSDDNHEKETKERWEKILKDFYAKNEKEIWTPLFLEKWFKLNFWDFFITGRFDRVDKLNWKEVEIVDYKTWKLRNEELVKEDLQLHLYAIALKQMWYEPKKAYLYFLDFDKKIEAHLDEKYLQEAQKAVINFHNQLENHHFPPSPSKEKCSCCSFRSDCKYKVK